MTNVLESLSVDVALVRLTYQSEKYAKPQDSQIEKSGMLHRLIDKQNKSSGVS